MHVIDIILKKRHGETLNEEELRFFVKGYTDGSIPDYQASSLLMAICIQGMTKEEIFWLTDAMKKSGDIVDLSGISGIKVDKHSTGGVGDKTTLIVGPMAAACGIPVAKMSGRGLGFTGGTVDKMESIPGFETSVDEDKFICQVNEIGLAIIGQTASIAPADKKIYGLRDVTGTVESIGLITSSVMSKKLAAGSDAIVLDVKCGNGAFVENIEDAVTLGKCMVEIGKEDGKKIVAIVTDMNQPLGSAVGNSLEVIEAIDTLKGKGPKDITELSLVLAGYMIYLGGKAKTAKEGKGKALQTIKDGSALIKLKEFIEAQGGDGKVLDDYSLFPSAEIKDDLLAEETGYINQIYAGVIGKASQRAGAGRETKDDSIDLASGLILHKKVGDHVSKGEVIATVYGNDAAKVEEGLHVAKEGFLIEAQRDEIPALIKEAIL